MAGITSGVGLITGVPIQDTINRLISLAARPKESLILRNSTAQKEQAAIGTLQSLILNLQLSVNKFVKPESFDKRKAVSGNADLLEAVVTGTPPTGTYSFTPVRLAQSQQLLSNGFASNTQPLGAGTVSFRFGGFVDEGLALDALNGGAGVRLGKIRLTDRSGATTEVDLRFSQTVNDVVDAINNQTNVRIRATTEGDRIRLVDYTGATTGNLRVEEVGTGSTAADLGLAGIEVAADTADGADVVRLFDSLNVTKIRSGNGLAIRDAVADLEFTFRDGSSPLQIDFNNEQTLGEILQKINAADPTRLRAEISPDGDRIRVIDLTSGAGTFAATSPFGGKLAEELGLTNTASGGVIDGGRLLGGLKSTALNVLNGGKGLGTLGSLNITNRAGNTTSVDLASAETLDDVIRLINSSNSGVTARYNNARNGILISDSTTSTLQDLVIANGDATNTADKLQIAATSSTGQINSGSLKQQVVSEQTTLDSLNGGKGIFRNTILLTDTNGNSASLRLLDAQYQNLGDVIDGINNLGIGIQARINDAGDGLVLIDTANGTGILNVRDIGSGRAAHELGIRGDGVIQTVGGASVLAINGSTTVSITLDADDTLQDLVSKINERNAGVVANLLNVGGSSNPFRLTLASQRSGKAGELLLDTSQSNISFTETSKAQDALVSIGASSTSSGLLVASNSNDFTNVVNGLRLTIKETSNQPVTVTIENSATEIVDAVKKFVSDYNKLRDEIVDLASFDPISSKSGVLFGSTEVLRIESDFGSLLSGRVFGAGAITSFEEVGITIDQQGKLSLNEQKLQDKFKSNPSSLKEFFTDADNGAAVRLNRVIDQLAGTPKVDGKPKGRSLLDARSEALQSRIDVFQIRIDSMTARLDSQRQLLEKQFATMESTIAKLQRNLAELGKIQPIVFQPRSR